MVDVADELGVVDTVDAMVSPGDVVVPARDEEAGVATVASVAGTATVPVVLTAPGSSLGAAEVTVDVLAVAVSAAGPVVEVADAALVVPDPAEVGPLGPNPPTPSEDAEPGDADVGRGPTSSVV